MDDINLCDDDEEQLATKTNKVATRLEEGDMPCQKLISNSKITMKSYPEEKWSKTMSHWKEGDSNGAATASSSERSASKTLGLNWDTLQDTYSYNDKEMELVTISKRTVCALAAKDWDPLGFTSPCTLVAKLNVRDINKLQAQTNMTRKGITALNQQLADPDAKGRKAKLEALQKTMGTLAKEVDCEDCKSYKHSPIKCQNYLKRIKTQRALYLLILNICTRCMEPGHSVLKCTSDMRCQVRKCNALHHTTLHSSTVGWDTPLNELEDPLAKLIVKRTLEYQVQSREIHLINFKRYIPAFDKKRAQIIIFTDGSTEAYATVSYLRVPKVNEHFECHLLAVKSRIAPMKTRTVPELELLGATMGANLGQYLKELLEVDDIIYFSDATTVCQWLQDPSKDYKVFVKNRLVTITEITGGKTFLHVSTEENPADIPTRGMRAGELMNCELYWKGPPWLAYQESEWPVLTFNPDEAGRYAFMAMNPPSFDVAMYYADVEGDLLVQVRQDGTMEPIVSETVFKNPVIDSDQIANFANLALKSKLDHLNGAATSWSNLIRNETDSNGPKPLLTKVRDLFIKRKLPLMDHQRLQRGFVQAVREIQAQGMKQDFIAMAKSGKYPKHWEEEFFFDQDGVVRLKGRINDHAVPNVNKAPIYLPKHKWVQMLMRQEHVASDHKRGEAIEVEVYNKYTGPGMGRFVRDAVRNCPACQAAYGNPKPPLMGRVRPHQGVPAKPMTSASMDICGPFAVKTRAMATRGTKDQKKCYIMVVCCLNTGLVAMEPTSSLDTKSIARALQILACRYSNFKRLHTDNAATFKSLAKEINIDELHLEVQSVVQNWSFSAPRDHEGNGLAERMIRVVREVLATMPMDFESSWDDFRLAIYMTQDRINSRPIYIDKNGTPPKVYTPNHFLKEKLNGVHGPESAPINLGDRFEYVEEFVNSFKKKFSDIYLQRVRSYQKYSEEVVNLKLNQYVVVVMEQQKRSKWPLAIITEVFQDDDKMVREVKIKECQGGQEKIRHARVLIPIDFYATPKL